MLTAADLVFLVDASGSESDIPIIDWLHGLVIGDTNNDGVKDDLSIAERLAAQGIDDVRYGLIGQEKGTFYFFRGLRQVLKPNATQIIRRFRPIRQPCRFISDETHC